MGITCPSCGSVQFKPYGFYKEMQVYFCKACNRRFTEKSLYGKLSI